MIRPVVGSSSIVVAALAGALVGAHCSRPSEPPRAEEPRETATPVAAIEVTTANIRATVHVTGFVRPTEGAEFLVVAPETARLIEAPRNVGEMVAAGDLLARFDMPVATGEVARHRADVARAEADLERARQVRARVADFVARGLVPRRDRDDAERTVADAIAAVERASSSLSAAETGVARGVVRAPFAGIVAARLHVAGDLVRGTAADPVLRLVDPARLEIAALVEDADAARVVPGASARMTTPVENRVMALTVAAAPHRTTPTGPLSVRLTPDAPVLVPVESSVPVDIDAEERTNVVFLPEEAIIRTDGLASVMVARGDRAERRAVVTGISDRGRVEVVSGVAAGDLVITRGHLGLPEGALISVAVDRRSRPTR